MTTREKAERLLKEMPEERVPAALAALEAVESDADAERKAAGEAIAEGYRRVPQSAEEDAWAVANAREAIREEPW